MVHRRSLVHVKDRVPLNYVVYKKAYRRNGEHDWNSKAKHHRNEARIEDH